MPHTVAVVVGLVSLAVVAADAGAGEPTRVIRIYDASHGDRATLSAAILTSAALLNDAGIAADWLDCTDGSATPGCDAIRGARDLVVRIAPRPVVPAHPTSDSVSTRDTVTNLDLQLGFATFDAVTRRGVMATIFHDHVLTVAQRVDVDDRMLLGRAIAHEVGHLLLSGGGHGASGLMRAVWTDEELTQNRRDDWVFASAERERLHAAASTRAVR